MKQIIGVLIVSLLLPGLLSAGETQTLKMKIEGMTCGYCVKKVESQLFPLCKELLIDWEKGEAVCKYEPPMMPEQILSEANKTGFKTTKMN